MASVEIFPCAQRLLHLMYLEAFLLVGPKLCGIFLLFFSNNHVDFIKFLIFIFCFFTVKINLF
jgi:hypothetical protein